MRLAFLTHNYTKWINTSENSNPPSCLCLCLCLRLCLYVCLSVCLSLSLSLSLCLSVCLFNYNPCKIKFSSRILSLSLRSGGVMLYVELVLGFERPVNRTGPRQHEWHIRFKTRFTVSQACLIHCDHVKGQPVKAR